MPAAGTLRLRESPRSALNEHLVRRRDELGSAVADVATTKRGAHLAGVHATSVGAAPPGPQHEIPPEVKLIGRNRRALRPTTRSA